MTATTSDESTAAPIESIEPTEPTEPAARVPDAEIVARVLAGNDAAFEVLMRRFDALQPYRKALASILLAQTRDPAGALAGLAALQRSMTWMLEAAGLEAEGLRGLARARGLTLLYLATLRTWLRDESLDLAKTMAALDGYLRRLEALLRRLPRRRDEERKAAE